MGAADEVPQFQECPQNIELKWQAEVSSSVYATPLITDLYSDGQKDIIVPSFVHYLEVLEGANGAPAVGWPAFHKSTVHASPLLYDIDFDGVRDVMVASYDGEMLFYNERLAFHTTRPPCAGRAGCVLIVVSSCLSGCAWPPLRVRRNWFVGLHPDPIDHSNPDVKDEGPSGGGRRRTTTAHKNQQTRHPPPPPPTTDAVPISTKEASAAHASGLPLQQRVSQLLERMRAARASSGGPSAAILHAATRTSDPELHLAAQQALSAHTSAAASTPPAPSTPDATTTAAATSRRSSRHLMGQDTGTDSATAAAAAAATAASSTRLRNTQQAMGEGSDDSVISPSSRRDRRHLMGDEGGSASGGVEELPENRLSQEAQASMDIFSEDGYGADGRYGGGDGGGGERGTRTRCWTGCTGASSGAASRGTPGCRLGTRAGALGRREAPERQRSATFAAQGSGSAYDEFGDRFEGREDLAGGVEDGAEESGEAGVQGGGALQGDAALSQRAAAYNEDYLQRQRARMEAHAAHVVPGGGGARGWEDESFQQPAHPQEDDFVMVDAHVLCTPALGDLDGDGHDELVVAVSYFYDREYYDDPAHAPAVLGLDLGKYLASGVVVFDLRSRSVKWSQHLDLSSEGTAFKAYAYSSPTLVDLDGDGQLEVVVGTSMGFLYVLNSDGSPREGWPIQMGEIQGQPLVADLNNDGQLEICVGDTRGNIAAWSASGEEIWERHVKSLISQAAVAADINGDGEIEVVWGTSSGHVYAVSGSSGLDVPHFPFRTHGRVHSPVLVTRLQDGPSQQLVVPSFDGFMYVIDGGSGCADAVDVGETSYSMVLADDLDGNGRLDLVLTTMNGNVYVFETPAEYHPLKTWTAQSQGCNGLIARHDYLGIYATKASRAPRDVAGTKLQVVVQVVDKRSVFAENGSLVAFSGGPYNISAVLKGVGVTEMASGHSPVIGVADTVSSPGTYTLELPVPKTRSTATIRLEMSDKHGLLMSDEFSLSFHLHFHKLLKWLVALPLLAMVVLTATREELSAGGYHAAQITAQVVSPYNIPNTGADPLLLPGHPNEAIQGFLSAIKRSSSQLHPLSPLLHTAVRAFEAAVATADPTYESPIEQAIPAGEWGTHTHRIADEAKARHRQPGTVSSLEGRKLAVRAAHLMTLYHLHTALGWTVNSQQAALELGMRYLEMSGVLTPAPTAGTANPELDSPVDVGQGQRSPQRAGLPCMCDWVSDNERTAAVAADAAITALQQAWHVHSPRLPRLQQLAEQLLQLRGEYGDRLRVLVYGQQRLTMHVLHYYTSRCASLAGLSSAYIYATGSRATPMLRVSPTQVSERVARFASGEVQVLFSTAASEEGVDIPGANCVVRFDAMQTAVSMVQGRGRARQEDSSFLVLREQERKEVGRLREAEEQQHAYVMSLAGLGDRMRGVLNVGPGAARLGSPTSPATPGLGGGAGGSGAHSDGGRAAGCSRAERRIGCLTHAAKEAAGREAAQAALDAGQNNLQALHLYRFHEEGREGVEYVANSTVRTDAGWTCILRYTPSSSADTGRAPMRAEGSAVKQQAAKEVAAGVLLAELLGLHDDSNDI
ncbi:MAG: hypothetical protein WDW36_007421 [Sanguina aurantia]